MPRIDIHALTDALRSGLAGSEPFAAIPMFVEQVRFLETDEGVDLIERLATTAHPSTWQFTGEVLDTWPSVVADRALDAVRALPAGEDRIEALCWARHRLTREEQIEVLQAVLNGSFEEEVPNGPTQSKPVCRQEVIVGFVRTLPAADREAWICGEAQRFGLHHEFLARKEVGSLTEAAMRDLWSRIQHDGERDVPLDYLRLASRLPHDLRRVALDRIRACPNRSTRLCHLAEFDEELTDAERIEVVEVPWSKYTRKDPQSIGRDHLPRMAHHLHRVPGRTRRRWLDTVLAFEDSYSRQWGLLALVPSLTGEDHERAVAGVLATLEVDGCFHSGETRWDLVPEDELTKFVLRLRDDPYGWHRDSLVEHIWAHRSAATADGLLALLVDSLSQRSGDARLEIARALTPWLADRSSCAVPRAIAQLPIPRSEQRPDAHYVIARLRREC